MSHAVTITRTTTTTTSTSAVILNTGYLKTVPGLLKLSQLIIGGFITFFFAWHFRSYYQYMTSHLFFLCIATAFFIGTFCLLASCLVSLSTGGIISKTIYELVYHAVAFILYLAASAWLMSNTRYNDLSHPPFLCAVLGLILSILYLISAVYAQRSYRGI
ncbi:CLUMA_CG013289, isoform A [Clunio marinus]|uniref:CLUMA_CG013289, isoform A n=1 Tax=Clunio marinus TaxID=568069 RepID=A0A1J1IIC5_9DIPT|nr:CLUMA_CG013289, isoform A [Clunio marinus]